MAPQVQKFGDEEVAEAEEPTEAAPVAFTGAGSRCIKSS